MNLGGGTIQPIITSPLGWLSPPKLGLMTLNLCSALQSPLPFPSRQSATNTSCGARTLSYSPCSFIPAPSSPAPPLGLTPLLALSPSCHPLFPGLHCSPQLSPCTPPCISAACSAEQQKAPSTVHIRLCIPTPVETPHLALTSPTQT